jgi:hypothetical protein
VTRLFLGHPELADVANTLVSAANGSERFAGQLFGLISTPQPLLGVPSVEDAKALVTRLAGEDVENVLARSAERIERAQDAHARGVPYFTRSEYSATHV